MSEPVDYQSRLKQALAAMQKMRARLEAVEQAQRQPIAVIGIGCRFPGGVQGPDAYWDLLRNGVDAITEVPPGRWDVDAFYDPDPDRPGKTYSRHGGFLEGLDQFDPQFFGIAPREANSMDPQQRLFMEVAWEALEHAALQPDKLKGSQAGVFVGITASDYMQLHARYMHPTDINAYLASGNVPNVTPGRFSYTLGLHGPSIALDTACSSSLVAIHVACQSIRMGESKLAIAGGVNVMLVPELLVAFSKWGMLSPDGRCKTFDAAADGFVRGEGCGVVILKPLADALAAGDNVLAVILGSAANQDGASSGLSVPNGLAQANVIRQALANANVAPESIRYVETHGTGTTLGDPIEVEALGEVLCRQRPADQPLAIGAVKTNFGHLEAASGVAGFIKVVLSLHHGAIPPHLHLQERTPHINWADLPIEIPTTLTPWPRGPQPRLAGVSSFGFSGTNAHIIVTEAPLAKAAGSKQQAADSSALSRPRHLLTLSAKNEGGLRDLAGRYASFLEQRPDLPLADVCATASNSRAHFNQRLAISAADGVEARSGLECFLQGELETGVVTGRVPEKHRPRLAFLFTGQGAQYLDMGRQLYETQPTFRAALDQCAELLRPYLDQPLLSVMFSEQETEDGGQRTETNSQFTIDDTIYTQPALFALEYALAQLWRSWGVEPDVVMGHSVGEYVAACIAGVMSLEDGLKLIAERGRLMQSLPENGAMAVVSADEAHVTAAIAPYADQVAIGAINGPANVVISGVATAVQLVLEALQAEGIKTRRLAISHAAHSPLMTPILDALEETAASITYAPPQISLISNVTGRPAAVNGQTSTGDSSQVTIINAAYWRQHLSRPVRFAQAMELLQRQGYELFLEIGPGSTLLGMGQQCLPEGEGSWLPSLRKGRDDWQQMLHSLAQLYVAGSTIDWAGFEADYAHQQRLSLPTYPFQRQRYWFIQEAEGPSSFIPSASSGQAPHPSASAFLGRRLRSPLLQETIFETEISTAAVPFLTDHRVLDMVVMPATGYVEMALAAVVATFGPDSYNLQDMTIHEALVLDPAETRSVQVILSDQREAASFKIYSLMPDNGTTKRRLSQAGGEDSPTINREQTAEKWTLHAAGTLQVEAAAAPLVKDETLPAIQQRCRQEVDVAAFYQQFLERGIQFGPMFQGIQQLWRQAGEALGQIELPAELDIQLAAYQFHPALLDACWQTFGAAWPEAEALVSNGRVSADHHSDLDTYMPVSLDNFRLYDRPGRRLWSHARLRPSTQANQETIVGDLHLLAEDGRLVAVVEGLMVKRTNRQALLRATQKVEWHDWLYEVAWQSQPLPTLPEMASGRDLDLPAVSAQLQPQWQQLLAQYRLATAATILPSLDTAATRYILQALQQLEWQPALNQPFTTAALATQLQVVEGQRPLLARLLAILAEEGWLKPLADGWELVQPLPPGDESIILPPDHPVYAGEINLLARCGPRLAELLRGECDPLQLLFPNGSMAEVEKLYQDAPTARTYNSLVAKAVATVVNERWPAGSQRPTTGDGQTPPKPKVRILEIGAGTGGTTSFILPHLSVSHTEYTFTDLSRLFLARAQEKFDQYPFITYQLLDVEQEPAAQDFALGQFDIIVAANVFHATRDLKQTLAHARQLLAPAGVLVFLEGVVPRRWIDLTFGLTEGWWRFADHDLRPDYPLLNESGWQQLLADAGFAHVTVAPAAGSEGQPLFPQAVFMAQLPLEEALTGVNSDQDMVAAADTWLLFADAGEVGRELNRVLTAAGQNSVLVYPGETAVEIAPNEWQLDPGRSADYGVLLQHLLDKQQTIGGVVHLWSLDLTIEAEKETAGTTVQSATAVQAQNISSILYLTQALVDAGLPSQPPLWLVTQGAQAVKKEEETVSPFQAPVWGLGKIIGLEHPELRCTCVDLDPVAPDTALLLAELQAADGESQVAWRQGSRQVARLVRHAVIPPPPSVNEIAAAPRAMRLEIETPGILDSLVLRPTDRRPPAAGEVEIEVHAVGLNFRDVLNAMDMYPGDAGALGGECTGRIVAVGEGVSQFAVGDAVIAIAPGCFGSHTTTRAEFVVAKPDHLSFEAAATILVTYLTAYYALHRLARLSAGERVLIHSAAGGVGMAAVHLAQQAGAEIFATAGSPQKRARLRSMGVPHVMNSRTLDFADEIMARTAGRGVDIILNSLADDFIPQSLSVLADGPGSRFLEIGKRGIWSAEQVAERKPDAGYFVIDLVAQADQKPQLIQTVLQEVMAIFNTGNLKPLPQQIFPMSEAVQAFRTMAQAKHVGKIVVTNEKAEGRRQKAERDLSSLFPSASSGQALLPSSFLITGGLAGLGLLVAQRLVEQGARHLVLLGRSRPSAETQAVIADLEQAGAQVLVAQADVSEPDQMKAVLAQIEQTMPPLRGIIHSAGVLDDGALVQQSWPRFAGVFAPKVDGGWLLHTLTRHLPLDFFILFSSGSALLGSPGQGNHAAANTFLDALAHYRRASGLPALSINWGVWSEVGAAARLHVAERAAGRGIGVISPEQGLQVLDYLWQQGMSAPPQVGVFPIQWGQFLTTQANDRFFALLADGQSQSVAQPVLNVSANGQTTAPPAETLLDQLQAAPASKRRTMLLTHVRSQAVKVLGLSADHTIDNRQSLNELGLDSLMAVELRNLLSSDLGLKRPLPATLVFDYPSVEALADYLLKDVLAQPLPDQTEMPAATADHQIEMLAELESLTDEEAEALLLAELTSVKGKK